MVIKELEEKPTKIPKSYRIQGSDETRRISATGGDLGRRTASSGWRQMEQKREARRLDKTPQNRTTSRLEDGLPVGDSRWRWTTDTSVGAGVRRVGGAAASLRNGGGRNSKGREGGWNSKEKRWEWRETGSFHTSLSLSLSLYIKSINKSHYAECWLLSSYPIMWLHRKRYFREISNHFRLSILHILLSSISVLTNKIPNFSLVFFSMIICVFVCIYISWKK